MRDNAVGFDMRHVEKLFGAFQRQHAPEPLEGTGIGLATVGSLVTPAGAPAHAGTATETRPP